MNSLAAQRPRIGLIDLLRGLALISMIGYHGCYDYVEVFAHGGGWFSSSLCDLWQQSILWTFVLVSGISCHFGKKHIRRGTVVFGAGLLVTAATFLFLRSEMILCGVLTFIGLAMLIFGWGRKFWYRLSPLPSFIACLLLFALTYELPNGALGLASTPLWELPEAFYQNNILCVLGFSTPDFPSADYVPLLPWFFLFMAGFYGWFLLKNSAPVTRWGGLCLPPVNWLGRHSLLVYLLHQPLLLAVFYLISLL